MGRMLIASLWVTAIALGASVQAWAASVTVSLEAGSLYSTSAISEEQTTGARMDGLLVTALFSSGGSQVLAWADTDLYSGAVTGEGWSLTQSGNTHGSPWKLNSSTVAITKLVIDAGAGDSVFDVAPWGSPSTLGSSSGAAFELKRPINQWDISILYSDLITLGAKRPVGDLFRQLTIDFADDTLFGPGQTLEFIADTDSLSRPGDLMPIPLPAAAWLFASGLIGLIGVRRRQRT